MVLFPALVAASQVEELQLLLTLVESNLFRRLSGCNSKVCRWLDH